MTTKRFCDKCGKEITGSCIDVQVREPKLRVFPTFPDFYHYHETCWGELKKILVCGEKSK